MPYPGRKNRLEEVLAAMVQDGVLKAVQTRSGATVYERGPGFQEFVIDGPQNSPRYQYHHFDPEDPRSHRRAIYRFLVRSQPQPFMAALDCADPSMSVGRRDESVTAPQALAAE